MAAFSGRWRLCLNSSKSIISSTSFTSHIQLHNTPIKSSRLVIYVAAHSFSTSPLHNESIKREVARKTKALKKKMAAVSSSPSLSSSPSPSRHPSEPKKKLPKLSNESNMEPDSAVETSVMPDKASTATLNGEYKTLPLNAYDSEVETVPTSNRSHPYYLSSSRNPLILFSQKLLDDGKPIILYLAPPQRDLKVAATGVSLAFVTMSAMLIEPAMSASAIGMPLWVVYTHSFSAALSLGIGLWFGSAMSRNVRRITLQPAAAKGRQDDDDDRAGRPGPAFYATLQGSGMIPFLKREIKVPLDDLCVGKPFTVASYYEGVAPVKQKPLDEVPAMMRPFTALGNAWKRYFHEIKNIARREPFVPLWIEKDGKRWSQWKVDVRGSALKGAEGFDFFVRTREE